MADIELVVKIDEETFKKYQESVDCEERAIIVHGTPLPKGHGRLIDADKIIFREIDEIGGEYEPYLGCSKSQIDSLPTVEAIPKADYENRLKADMVAMLTDIQLEIEELDVSDVVPEYQDGAEETREYIANMIEEKINSLKEAKNG